MTVALAAKEVASKIEENFPESVVESGQDSLLVKAGLNPSVLPRRKVLEK